MDTLAEYGRQILSLVVVFSLLGLTMWKLGRRRQTFSGWTTWSKVFARKARSSERVLESVERLVLTPQHTLHVVCFQGRQMLLATHPQGCALLDGAHPEGCALLDSAPERLAQETASRGAGA
jgi:hypothetical protein